MTWEQFYQQLEDGVQSVYCLSGPEEFVKASALEALRRKLLPEGLEAMNETILENAGAQTIIEAAETLPMMADRRLVLVRDWAPLTSGKAKGGSAEADRLCEWLPGAPDSCCLVFSVHGAIDGRQKASQALAKRGAVVQFDLLSDDKIMKWVAGQLKPLGKRMDGQAVQALVFMAGRELTRLHAELQKLAAYAAGRDVIERRDVEALVTPSLECTVFQMIDALMAGQKAGAHKLFKSMIESGETRVGVLFMLTRQLRSLTGIKRLKAQGMRMPEIEKKLQLNHFAAQNAERQTGKFSMAGLEAGYKACLDAEFDIKSGKLKDTLALDRLMLVLGEMK